MRSGIEKVRGYWRVGGEREKSEATRTAEAYYQVVLCTVLGLGPRHPSVCLLDHCASFLDFNDVYPGFDQLELICRASGRVPVIHNPHNTAWASEM